MKNNYTTQIVLAIVISLLFTISIASNNKSEINELTETITKFTTEIISETTTKEATTRETTVVTTEVVATVTEKKDIKYYSESDIQCVAKVLYSECRGVQSDTQKACVVWVICNRVDAYKNSTIQSVIKSKNQFAYNPYAPVKEELYNLAKDVLERWNKEKNGQINVGRVLPKNYLYFYGDGKRNYFRDGFSRPYNIWDYSLNSPYKN